MRLIHYALLMTFMSFSLFALVTVLDPYAGIDYNEPQTYRFNSDYEDECYCPDDYYWRYYD